MGPDVRRGTGCGGACRLAEGEGVSLDAGVEEFDGEEAFLRPALLTNQLIEPLVRNLAIALSVDIHAMVGPGGLAVECHAKADRLPA